MTLIKYLLYRIANRYLAFFFVRKSMLPLISAKGAAKLCTHRVIFDFSHPTTHLGDRLFFLPLICQLHSAGYELALVRSDRLTESLFTGILRPQLHFVYIEDSGRDLVIMPQPALLAQNKRHSQILLVDFTDNRCADVLTKQLIKSVNLTLAIDLVSDAPPEVKVPAFCRLLPADESCSYYIFNNYIDSGRFRKYFVPEFKLEKKALELKRLGHKIIHVGSPRDMKYDGRDYDFVDLDLRGATAANDISALLNDPRILGVVSYDNALMHLAGIFGKRAYILFRGRFSRTAYRHHMTHVNKTFFNAPNFIEYLT